MKRAGVLVAVLGTAAVTAPGAHAAPKKRPDLRVTKVAVSVTAVDRGGTLTIAETTANRGRAAARASQTAYLLSADIRLGTDARLATRRVPALRAGRSSSGRRSVALPAAVPAGTYHVLACADSARKVRESRETNNCRASAALTVRAPGAATPAPQAPGMPFITRYTPDSGADTDSVLLAGLAPAGTGIRVFRSESCSGDPVVATSAAVFTGAGVEVGVDQGRVTPFTVQAADAAGQLSKCSPPAFFEERAAREVEPNDSRPEADAAATGYGVLITGPRTFDGELQTQDDDYFRVVLKAPAALGIEVGLAGGSCRPDADPALDLLDAVGNVIVSDDDGRGDLCPLAERALDAGTYYVRVRRADVSGAFAYRLSVFTEPAALPLATTPPSPADDATPFVTGHATPGHEVELFRTEDCSGPAAVVGSADSFNSSGVGLTVEDDFITLINARGAGSDVCSPQPLRYAAGTVEKEPNDTVGTASPGLVLNGRIGGRIDSFGEDDMYTFTLTEAKDVRFTAGGLDAGCAASDANIYVLREDQTFLGTNDDRDGSTRCASVDLSLAPGSYRVWVNRGNKGDATTTNPFSYRLLAQELGLG